MTSFKQLSRWTRKRKLNNELTQLMTELKETLPTETFYCSTATDLMSNDTNTTELQQGDDNASDTSSSHSDYSDVMFDFDSDILKCRCFSDSESDNESDDQTDTIKDELAVWVKKFLISHLAVTALLTILRKLAPYLPKDCRTLLNDGSKCTAVITENVAGGSYCHFGLASGIVRVINEWKLDNKQPVKLHVNIDGLPIFRSTNDQF